MVEAVHRKILESYALDFAKYAPLGMIPKLTRIWQAIPEQLVGESGKFMLKRVGMKAEMIDRPLRWLVDAGVVHQVSKINHPKTPISDHLLPTNFKLYCVDVGLLRAMGGFSVPDLCSGEEEASRPCGRWCGRVT